MSTGLKVVVALVTAVVVMVGGVVVLVASGAAEAILDECSEPVRDQAEEIAATVRRELPGRTEEVDVTGTCSGQPYPSIGTRTSTERTELARELRRRWGCRQQEGTLPPVWDCGAGGHEVEVDPWDDGRVVVTAR